RPDCRTTGDPLNGTGSGGLSHLQQNRRERTECLQTTNGDHEPGIPTKACGKDEEWEPNKLIEPDPGMQKKHAEPTGNIKSEEPIGGIIYPVPAESSTTLTTISVADGMWVPSCL